MPRAASGYSSRSTKLRQANLDRLRSLDDEQIRHIKNKLFAQWFIRRLQDLGAMEPASAHECEVCHSKLAHEWHHVDYDRIEDVIAVCGGCHQRQNVERREMDGFRRVNHRRNDDA